MTNLISVIVPVYNAERYVKRCVESICGQTYTNLEIILVNDGSSDNSQTICESLAQEDPRIKLINQANGGSSIARNTGLDHATGDVIAFVDSDDHIDLEMLEKMLYLLNKHQLDVVEIERNAESEDVVFDNSFTIEDPISATIRIIRTTGFQVWKRIYRTSVIEDMRFIPKIIHQDAFFTVDVINRISKIGFLNSSMYRYNRESIGIIRSKYSAMKRDISVRIIEYIKANVPENPEIKRVLNTHIVGYYTDHFMLLSRNTEFDKDGSHRKKLKKDIFKSLNRKNIGLRSAAVILLPLRLMEFISQKLYSVKNNQQNNNLKCLD